MENISTTVFRNISFNFLRNLLIFFFGLLTSIIVARFLGPRNLGSFNLVLWTIGIIRLLVNMGINNTLVKYISEYEGRSEQAIVSKMIGYFLKLELVLSVTFCLLILLFSKNLAMFFSNPEAAKYFMIAGLTLIPNAMVNVFSGALVGFQNYKSIAIIRIIILPFNFILSLYVLWKGYGITGLLIVQIVISVPEVILFYNFVKNNHPINYRDNLSNKVKSKLFKYNMSAALITFIDAIVWQRSEVFFLGKFSTDEQIAFYSLPYGLTTKIMVLVPGVFSGVLLPLLSKFYGERNFENIKVSYALSTRYLSMLAFPICTGGFVLAPYLITGLYGEDYLPAVDVLKILLISGSLGAISAASSAVVLSIERINFMIKAGLVLAVMNITLDIVFIPYHGAIGAAIANSTTQVLAVITGAVYVHNFIKIKYPLEEVVRMLAASISMALIMQFCISFFGNEILTIFCSMFLAVAFYPVTLILYKAIVKEDIEILYKLLDIFPGWLNKSIRQIIIFTDKYYLKYSL